MSEQSIKLIEINKLLIHEEIIDELADKVAKSIKSEGYLLNPIIIDRNSLVVIDGMHRVAALKKLNAKLAPVYELDYMSSEVSLHVWYRLLKEEITRRHIDSIAERNSLNIREVDFQEAVDGLRERRYVACFILSGYDKLLALSLGKEENILTIYDYVSKLDAELRGYGLVYLSEKESLTKIKAGELKVGYLVPPISKEEVVSIARMGRQFPPKTTRHVVNLRPMFLFTPLELLTAQNIEEAKQHHQRIVSSLKWIDLPPNQFIDRFYEEPTRVYIHRQFIEKYPSRIREIIEKTM